MIDKHIKLILLITGLITMLPVVQFFAPDWMLQQQSLVVADDAGRLFAQHWGLVVFCIGSLLVYAAMHPGSRRSIVCAGLIQKLGLVVLLLMNWRNPALQGLHMVAIFDAICVLLYAIYLFGSSKSSDATPD
jgi:hypothetical protein